MAENSPEMYDLYLTGQLADGFDKAQTLQRLATMFKRPVERVEPLLMGKPHRIKRDVTEAELVRFQQVLDRIGVLYQSKPTRHVEATRTASDLPGATASALALSPSGTPVLTEAERRQPPTPEIDTSAIGLTATGTPMSDPAIPVPLYAPSLDHLSLATAGENLGNERLPLPEIDVDDLTKGMSLAPSGSRMSEPDERPPPPSPDVSHLKIQP